MENKKIPSKIKLRKHLNADSLFKSVYSNFEKFSDIRTGNVAISMSDTLMSGFAMFSLKDPSLLAFDNRRQDKAILKIYNPYMAFTTFQAIVGCVKFLTMLTLQILGRHTKLFFEKFNVAVHLAP